MLKFVSAVQYVVAVCEHVALSPARPFPNFSMSSGLGTKL